MDNSSLPKNNSETLEWFDFEYFHTDKHPDWFWVVGLAGLLSIVLSIVFKNFLFAIVLLISTFTVMLYGARPPELIHFILTKKGLRIKNDLHPFKNLKSFAVREDDPAKLMVESDRLLLPRIIIPLGTIDPEEVRLFLSQYLPEVEFEESTADIISEFLGF